jgi:D-amino-acid oxidase
VARDRPLDTTSRVAGAIRLPFRVGPPDRATAWARATRLALSEIARTEPDAGVDELELFLLSDDRELPWWRDAAPDLEVVAPPFDLDARHAFRLVVPRCDPPIYLPWLESHLRRRIVVGTATDLAAVEGDLVVNCTGLGSRTLAADRELGASFGQIVGASLGGTPATHGLPSFDPRVALSDERDSNTLFYVIPRRTELVLGGSAVLVDPDAGCSPVPAITARILARCRASGFDPGGVLYERAALRPIRPEVRLERSGRIIHNYGHGGAGYTLSWGAAEEVVALAEKAIRNLEDAV